MKVTLLAHSRLNDEAYNLLWGPGGILPKESWIDEQDDTVNEEMDYIPEFAGRACYQSFDRPNMMTAKNRDYLANIVRQRHFSVLEHASATFYVEGVSRSLTHELVRHRHLSYSQLSQRYVDPHATGFVKPPALSDDEWNIVLPNVENFAERTYDIIYENLTERGLPRKQAREAARAVLPNATETKIVVTGNMRAWRDFLGKRWHVAADAEIREFAGEILDQLRSIAPNSFADIPAKPYEN